MGQKVLMCLDFGLCCLDVNGDAQCHLTVDASPLPCSII